MKVATRIGLLICTIAVVAYANAVPGAQSSPAAPDLGRLKGLVTDERGVLIPAAVIVIEGNGFRREVGYTEDGSYQVDLPAGRYRITIRSDGYKTRRDQKVRIRAGSTRLKDFMLRDDPPSLTSKSRSVRRALEAQYARIARANQNKDPDALLALRTPDFSAKFPNGEIRNSEQMAGYSRALIEQIQPPISVANTIETLSVSGKEAVAVVHQRFSRMQFKAGQLRKVETEARQRETWLLTPAGWKLKFVDDVQPGAWYVDGKRVDPAKPYDPSAPPYNPTPKPD